MLKGVFQSFHLKTKDFNIGHFNILKFHTLIYFEENIRLYKYIDRYYTSVNREARHHYIIKAFYNLINKRDLLS
jgi:hypothetical protein